MSNLLNLIPPIRHYRLHRIRILLDPVYEAKIEKLDKFRNQLFKWSLRSFISRDFILLFCFFTLQFVFVWKIHFLYILMLPTIALISMILVSVQMYLSFRKELKMDD